MLCCHSLISPVIRVELKKPRKLNVLWFWLFQDGIYVSRYLNKYPKHFWREPPSPLFVVPVLVDASGIHISIPGAGVGWLRYLKSNQDFLKIVLSWPCPHSVISGHPLHFRLVSFCQHR